uniref:NADH dehydrogenase [ubiquinone] 1 beta subcomplex subunit 2, mitochondrial n=1 Tax=Monodelphis domestica TaxID=13616 RepID=A0A5F8GG02_MONDO
MNISYSPILMGDIHIEPCYQKFPYLTKFQLFKAELLSATIWFWILWCLGHHSDAVLGHFSYPGSSKWANEELGIPFDDEDLE